MKPIFVNQKEMAHWLSLGDRRVRDLTTMKVLTMTPKGYDLSKAVPAYITFLRAKTGSVSDERARLLKSQADMSELKVQHRQGELVTRESVEAATFTAIRAARDRLFNIPDRVAGLLAAETDQHKIHAMLTKEIHQMLEDLSDVQRK